MYIANIILLATGFVLKTVTILKTLAYGVNVSLQEIKAWTAAGTWDVIVRT